MTTRIKVTDFAQAMHRYVRSEVKKANADKSTMLTAAEAKALPKDLRDNFEAMGRSRVDASRLMAAVAASAARATVRADRNHDGFLSHAEARTMPVELRDNFRNYARAQMTAVGDTTAASVRRAHEAAFPSRVGYDEAFKKAAWAVLQDGEYPETPRFLLKERFREDEGRVLTAAAATAELRKVFKGLELLPIGEVGETYAESATHWVFKVDVDVGTDHAFWATVDRETGEATVEGFN